jgi:predicted 3-demethylubiquinone-9 3-methyltransferase (glyoxalase superfamily)
MSQATVPFLWFDTQAEEAAKFYVSVFGGDSHVDQVTHYPKGTPGPEGSVMTVAFTLRGQRFVGLNGGPLFKFTEAVSFAIECRDQAEIDHFWNRLTEGGEPGVCGWLKDRYGLSWQVVPDDLWKLLSGGRRTEAVMQQVMQMTKPDVARLRQAAATAEA